jgi:hypothetical protein
MDAARRHAMEGIMMTFQLRTLVRLLIVLGLASMVTTAFALSRPVPDVADGYYVNTFAMAGQNGVVEGRASLPLPDLR